MTTLWEALGALWETLRAPGSAGPGRPAISPVLLPYLAVALVFIVVTFPLARVVDWLIARDRSRAAAGAR